MTRLTAAQKNEIDRHKIPLSKVFDATGLTRQQSIAAMAEDKEIVMVNGMKCRNDQSHILRSRHGHCVECNPATLAYQNRKSEEGHLYLSGSRTKNLLKIGMASDPDKREATLRRLCYGGASDWTILALAKSDKAGAVEYASQNTLRAFQVEGTYLKDGREQTCYELFRCDYKTALDALQDALKVVGGDMLSYKPFDIGFAAVNDPIITHSVEDKTTNKPTVPNEVSDVNGEEFWKSDGTKRMIGLAILIGGILLAVLLFS